MAIMFLYGKGKKDPYQIYDGYKKLKNGDVLPFEIVKYLRKNGIKTNVKNFCLLNKNQKKEWIKQEIGNNKPVIIIIGNKKYLHYITVVGYNENAFCIYDSRISDDINGNNPGNIDINTNDVIKVMDSAVFKGIHIELMISETE
jgi:hypothetical protein